MGALANIEAVTADQFAARMQALDCAGAPFAIAVSGGRDSMALARLAAGFSAATGARVLALTVDHQLREGSAREADLTAGWCRKLGMEHRILRWRGAKPEAGVQAQARQARYFLMAKELEETQIRVLATAHSADDQAETIFMRLSRGAGLKGLSGIDDEIKIAAGAGPPIRLIRPMLAFTRAELTATAGAHGQDFCDDPGNDDPAYERIRVRALLGALYEQEFISRDALLRMGRRARRAELRVRLQEEKLFAALGGCFFRWGGVCLNTQRLHDFPHDPLDSGLAGLCRRLIFAAGANDHPPEEDAAFDAMQNALTAGAATIGGVLIKNWRGGLWLIREPAALLGRAGATEVYARDLPAGETILWDNRFIFRGPGSGEPVSVRPLGPAGADQLAEKKGLFRGPNEALIAMPGLFVNDTLIGAFTTLSEGRGAISANSLTAERFAGDMIRFSRNCVNFAVNAHGAGLS